MYICTQSWVGFGGRSSKGRQASSLSIHGQEKLGIEFYRALTMQTTLIYLSDGSGLSSTMIGSKKTNPIKINLYRTILRQLILGDLSTDISNIGPFFFTVNDMSEQFPHIVSAADKKRDIGRYKTVLTWLLSTR